MNYYNLRKHFFSNRIVAVWTSLPNIIASAESTNVFKIVWINSGLINNLNLTFVPTFTGIGSPSINSLSYV